MLRSIAKCSRELRTCTRCERTLTGRIAIYDNHAGLRENMHMSAIIRNKIECPKMPKKTR